MIQLFLHECDGSNNGNNELVVKRKALLNELESVLLLLISSSGRSEARLWLCNVIGGIKSISPSRQREIFVKLLKAKPLKHRLTKQLLQLLFTKQPNKAGSILAKKSSRLENFFKENPRRIMQWFSNFAGAGGLEHGKGAKALSQFAFVNRDICWEELEWKGKHGQSPAMVATKPHYFLDLDVQRTVENFLEYVPEFWSSREFAESLKDGEILGVDTEYFIDMFVGLMHKEDCKELWEIIDEFLLKESFLFLCQHLLILLEEKDLCYFTDVICKFLKPRSESLEHGEPSFWLEVVLAQSGGCPPIDQLLLINAVTNQARHLLRLVREEAEQDGKQKTKDIVLQLTSLSASCASTLPPTTGGSSKKENLELIKLLGLESWAIYFRLSEEFQTAEAWESLFVSNGIAFRKSDKYDLLTHEGSSEESGDEQVEKPSGKAKYKRKHRGRKKRRKNVGFNASGDDDLLDNNDSLNLRSKAGGWLLSTDKYSATWSSVDLPEHISQHCFFTWMKRAIT